MKTLVIIVVVIVVAVGGYFLLKGDTTTPDPTVDNSQEEVNPPVGGVKEFDVTAKKWEFSPNTITVNKGDMVKLHIKSIDVTHGFGLLEFGIDKQLKAGETIDVEFVANKTGTFTFSCQVFCGTGHSNMKGELIVE